jgi:hypothetical protein
MLLKNYFTVMYQWWHFVVQPIYFKVLGTKFYIIYIIEDQNSSPPLWYHFEAKFGLSNIWEFGTYCKQEKNIITSKINW